MPSLSKTILVDFIRHGEPRGGDILRGRVDPKLTDLGWSQMQMATNLTSDFLPSAPTPKWNRIITSPLKRCYDFAERVAEKTNLELNVDHDWQEINYGDWDGMLVSEWRKVAADQFKAFREDLSAFAPPNGESYLNFKDRILRAYNHLAQGADGSHILVVTHGGVLRVVLPSVLGMPLNKSFPLYIPFACYSRIKIVVEDGNLDANLIFHNGAEYRSFDN
jgi:broad specificity phosphatase PhoE